MTRARILSFLLTIALSAFFARAGLTDLRTRGAEVPFAVGEEISHVIKYGPLSGGSSKQTVQALAEVDGRRAYHIVSESRSKKGFLRKIRERNQSWMDVETLSSLRHIEEIRNGSYRKTSETHIDPESRRLIHTYKTNKHSGETANPSPDGVQDLVSVIYFLRTMDLAVGEAYEIPLQVGGEVQNLKVLVKEVGKVKVPAGEFDCFHIVPEVDGEGTDQLALELWLTNDERKIPVLIRSKLSIGSVVAQMTSYFPGS